MDDRDLLDDDSSSGETAAPQPAPTGPPSLEQMAERWVKVFGNRKQQNSEEVVNNG